MGRKKKQRVKLVSDEQMEEEFGLGQPDEEKSKAEDARAMVNLYASDIVRALLLLLDERDWGERLKLAEEVRAGTESLVEECEAMVPGGGEQECPHGDAGGDPDNCSNCQYEASIEARGDDNFGPGVSR